MAATGGKWSFSMPRGNMETFRSRVPGCHRASCAHANALEGFPFVAGLPAEDVNRTAAQ
ncbi:unnamed protein product [Diplocarpon coronariae]